MKKSIIDEFLNIVFDFLNISLFVSKSILIKFLIFDHFFNFFFVIFRFFLVFVTILNDMITILINMIESKSFLFETEISNFLFVLNFNMIFRENRLNSIKTSINSSLSKITNKFFDVFLSVCEIFSFSSAIKFFLSTRLFNLSIFELLNALISTNLFSSLLFLLSLFFSINLRNNRKFD